MNTTTTSNTQATLNYEAATDVILAILDDFNFRTDIKFDPQDLKRKIIKAIQVNIEGNINHTNVFSSSYSGSGWYGDGVIGKQ